MATGAGISRVITAESGSRRLKRDVGMLDRLDGTVTVWCHHQTRRHVASVARVRRLLISRGYTVQTWIGDPPKSALFGSYSHVSLTVSGSAKRRR